MSLMYIFLAAVVEGVTEFLPISSTGHLIILNHLLKIEVGPLVSSFNIFIQLGAILAVVSLYYQEIIQNKKQLINLLISFIPTAIVGFVAYPFIKQYLLGNITVTAISLLLGGLLIFFLPSPSKSKSPLSWFDYFKIGLFQSVSVIPGASRALMSIIGGLYSGLTLSDSIKYSFLLAIPTIGAATFLDILKNKELLLQNPNNIFIFLLGFFLSFLTAKLTINFFLNLVKTKDLKVFGVYRIILSLVILVISLFPL